MWGRRTAASVVALLAVALFATSASAAGSFDDDDGNIHESAIEAIAAAGITKGCNPPDNTRYCPDDPVTRAQMATFLMRSVGLDPIQPAPVVGPGSEDDALVARFEVTRHESDRTNRHSVRNMGYWPRSFRPGLDVNPVPGTDGWQVDRVDDAGAYAGWDALTPGTSWGFEKYGKDDGWFRFRLNRPATVAVVWRDDAPRPSWLRSGWTERTPVEIDGRVARVYTRSYPAGLVKLGTVEGSDSDPRTMYTVLLAEADGEPTPAPETPGNRGVPTPGEPCPSWVHDRHVTEGPDGELYQTWHPQWDPVYWCSFGHEHGSNPALIPGSPMVPYGYVADKVPQDEPNMGFKEFIFKDLSNQHWVRFVIHAGTASDRRVCARFHTLYVQVYDTQGTELMNVGFKADYGAAVAVKNAGPLDVDCPGEPSMQQLLNQLGDERVRELNVAGLDHSYERWRSMDDTQATRNLGLTNFRHGFDIRNPMTQCVDLACDRVVQIDDPDFDNATRRTLDMSGWKDPFLFNVGNQALATGEFYTNPYGTKKLGPSSQHSTRQYIDPSVSNVDFLIDSGVNRIMCVADDPWTMLYDCIEMRDSTPFPHVEDMNIQYSIRKN